MFRITPYQPSDADLWNGFVARSKNATFLFHRQYMDYHADRFRDASLMFWMEGRLTAVLPAHRCGDVFCSHNGLTYGGLLMDGKATAERVSVLFALLNGWLRREGFRTVRYKPVPWIYHQYGAEEDLYALFKVCGAQLVGRDVSAMVCMERPLPWRAIRSHGARVAQRHGCTVYESEDYPAFWQILTDNLREKYGVAPVHSLGEMQLLHSRFPRQIRLFVAAVDGRVEGGAVLYVCRQTIHVQYIAASPEGKRLHVLDALFDRLLHHEADGCRYFDFGKSTATDSCTLNGPLAYQKEGFGARSVCYDTYQWTL